MSGIATNKDSKRVRMDSFETTASTEYSLERDLKGIVRSKASPGHYTRRNCPVLGEMIEPTWSGLSRVYGHVRMITDCDSGWRRA